MDPKNKIADLYQESRAAWEAYVISRAREDRTAFEAHIRCTCVDEDASKTIDPEDE